MFACFIPFSLAQPECRCGNGFTPDLQPHTGADTGRLLPADASPSASRAEGSVPYRLPRAPRLPRIRTIFPMESGANPHPWRAPPIHTLSTLTRRPRSRLPQRRTGIAGGERRTRNRTLTGSPHAILHPDNKKSPAMRGFYLERLDQKNEPIKTERMLIHDQRISPTTTTMGNPWNVRSCFIARTP